MNTTTAQQAMDTIDAQFQTTLAGAVDACLWSTTPTPNDDDVTPPEPADQYAIAPEELDKLRGTLAHHMAAWFIENYPTLHRATNGEYTWEHIGHDFWLTSQEHGAGFWDRGLDEAGDTLTDSVSGYEGIVDLYLNDDGTHVLVDPYNVHTFTTALFRSN